MKPLIVDKLSSSLRRQQYLKQTITGMANVVQNTDLGRLPGAVNTPVGSIMYIYLAPGKFERNFRYTIFKQILVIDGWGISCEIALILMSLDLTADQLTFVKYFGASKLYIYWCAITRPP